MFLRQLWISRGGRPDAWLKDLGSTQGLQIVKASSREFPFLILGRSNPLQLKHNCPRSETSTLASEAAIRATY